MKDDFDVEVKADLARELYEDRIAALESLVKRAVPIIMSTPTRLISESKSWDTWLADAEALLWGDK